jgi:hypothetical protein
VAISKMDCGQLTNLDQFLLVTGWSKRGGIFVFGRGLFIDSVIVRLVDVSVVVFGIFLFPGEKDNVLKSKINSLSFI